MPELGVTQTLPVVEVFKGESAEFTPWLSMSLYWLAEELGLELESEDTEVSVGPSIRAAGAYSKGSLSTASDCLRIGG